MTGRRFALAALAALSASGVTPIAVLAASSPNPLTLRAAMADAVETDFVEELPGTPNTLEGPFNAERYARSAGGDAKSVASILQALHDYEFVGGFGRDWLKSNKTDQLEELLMVFANDQDAATMLRASRDPYAKEAAFQSFFDPQISDVSFGVSEGQPGYYWTIVLFAKGNDVYVIERGSPSSPPMQQGLAQANKAFAVAPDRISVTGNTLVPDFLAAKVRTFAIWGSIVMLAAAAVIIVVLLRMFTPRSTPVPQEKP